MGTVRDLVTGALLDLGAIAGGEVPTAQEAQDALRRLNLLLETWRLEALMVYAIDTVTLALTGATSYTLGIGGQINTARPVRLSRAAQRHTSGATVFDWPLQVLTDAEYERIALKTLTIAYSSWVYMDRAYPLASVFLWPIAPAGDTLVFYLEHPLTAFASLDTAVALPPGYELALQCSLAVELSSSYRDCQVTEALAAQANRSKALLKIANAQPRFLTLPAGVLGGRQRGATDEVGFRSGWNT